MPFNLLQADPALTAARAGIEKRDATKERERINRNRRIIGSD
jgi:hypothetical protein